MGKRISVPILMDKVNIDTDPGREEFSSTVTPKRLKMVTLFFWPTTLPRGRGLGDKYLPQISWTLSKFDGGYTIARPPTDPSVRTRSSIPISSGPPKMFSAPLMFTP